MIIGFVVNPIAGMGGRVGLKGTDGVIEMAIERGAVPISPKIAREFLGSIRCRPEFLTPSGNMGEDYLAEYGYKYRVVYKVPEVTTAEDTEKACRRMKSADLIVFVGGDGTARDVIHAIGSEKPIIGVPAGVKMYSSCFALTPEKAALLLCDFIEGRCSLKYAEVMDIDERAYRNNELKIRLYSFAKIPYVPEFIQSSKKEGFGNEEGFKEDIAQYVIDEMEPDTVYILGAGTSTAKIAEKMGVEKTLLGLDAYYNGKVLKKDISEKDILELINKYKKIKIIVSPIGSQGFILGRGNQQLSDKVIEKVGKENIIVIATPQKLRETPQLHVYTGNQILDESFRGYIKVLTGYGKYTLKKVV